MGATPEGRVAATVTEDPKTNVFKVKMNKSALDDALDDIWNDTPQVFGFKGGGGGAGALKVPKEKEKERLLLQTACASSCWGRACNLICHRWEGRTSPNLRLTRLRGPRSLAKSCVRFEHKLAVRLFQYLQDAVDTPPSAKKKKVLTKREHELDLSEQVVLKVKHFLKALQSNETALSINEIKVVKMIESVQGRLKPQFLTCTPRITMPTDRLRLELQPQPLVLPPRPRRATA